MADSLTIIGTAAAAVPAVEQSIIARVKRHIERALNAKSNLDHLKSQVEILKNAKETIQGLVDEARDSQGREIHWHVENWLTNKVEPWTRDDTFTEDEGKAKKRCFIGLCPNYIMRYRISVKVEEEAKEVAELLEEATSYDAVEKISRLPFGMGERPESFRSREIIVEHVVDELTVLRKSKLGVYGMGGVGKTTLVKVVAVKVMEKKSFDFVVLCEVTAVQNIANIQREIMDQLGLEIKEETLDARAARLLRELEKMLKEKKKILFVLDDLWKKLKLEAVGIPSPDQHKGCQILMTSRHRLVLSIEMGCDNNVINIGLLTEDEAWELFKKMSGNNLETNDALQSKAYEVAQACARLPIAIVAVARALKDRTDLFDWETALLDLRRPSPSNFSKVKENDSAIGENVNKSIYLSYKLLASDELRSTLLLCSQLLNNSSIRDLLRCSWSLHLLPDSRVRNVEEAQNMLCYLVGQLQDSCLLVDTGSNERIALHDVVRVITQAIALEEQHVFIANPEDEPTDFPDDENCTRMWLHCKIAKLPEKLGCRQLELFHMDSKSSSLEVPDSIFKLEARQCLKVLSLTNFSFPRSLPTSLESLKENLRTLRLDGSSLEDTAIVIIGELENLEILSFAKCKIRRLPEEIGMLKKLKILDLSDCSKRLEIPCDVISRLSLLEELYMGNSFSGWGKGGAEASLAEVRMLHHLSNLEIAIPDAGVMVENLFSKGLKRYRVTIGTHEWWNESYGNRSKLLRISLNTSIGSGCLNGIQTLLFDEKTMLPELEELELVSTNMKTLWDGPFEAVKFSIQNLRRLSVGHCPSLKYLFTSSMVGCLAQLEYLSVRDCDEMEEIILTEEAFIGEGRIDKHVIVFSKLDALYLWGLPILKRFCTASLILCPLLKKISLRECHALKTFVFNSSCENKSVDAVDDEDLEEKQHEKHRPLFDEKVSFPSLEEMEIEHLDNLEKIWNDQLSDDFFCTLRSLQIENCTRLLNVFPFNICRIFKKLEELRITNCYALEEIFDLHGPNVEGRYPVVDFQLRCIYLDCLRKLRCIWNKDPDGVLSFRNLQSVTVSDCPALKNIFPSSIAKDLVQLEDLKIKDCAAVEEIVAKAKNLQGVPRFKFSKLSSLTLKKLPKLKNFYPGPHTSEWPVLKDFEVTSCVAVKSLFTKSSVLEQVHGDGHLENQSQQPVSCGGNEI